MKKNNVVTTVILFIIAFVLLVLIVIKNNNNSYIAQNTTATIQQMQQSLSPYQAKDNMEKVLVVSDFRNTTKNNMPTQRIKKTLAIKGVITSGYLYIKANVNFKPLNKYSDIYLSIIDFGKDSKKEYGGHLVGNQSLETHKSKVQTELLYDLSGIPYKKNFDDSDTEVISVNWLKIINTSSAKKVIGFSSTKQQGDIQELSIYYKCLEKTECLISIN